MRLKLAFATMLATAFAIVAGLTITPAAEAAHGSPNLTAIPVSGTIPGGGTFTGTANITDFAVQNGQLVANGTLTGTLLNSVGGVIGSVTNAPISLPVTTANGPGSCQILDLTLGPLDLNLLGLVVHLDVVHLNITAQQGPGNLLGNLLCAVAHLLDGNGSANALQQLVNRLNQIVAGL